MSRVRTKTVKKAAKAVINEYETKLSKHDFQTNKQVVQEFINRKFHVENIDAKGNKILKEYTKGFKSGPQSKKLRNKIAGLITHYMRRNDLIDKGVLENGREVKGIKLAVREEQRERRENYQPEVSELDPSQNQEIHIDEDTALMLAHIGFEREDKTKNIPVLHAVVKGDENKRTIPMVQTRESKK